MKLGSSRGMDTKRPRGSGRSKPCHQLQLTRRSQPPYLWPPEQAQPGVSKPCRTTLDRLVDIANDHWLEVTGEGSVNAAPDFARVALGVTNTEKTAGEAMAANAKAANALVSLIKSEGVAPANIQTSELSISPMFSQAPPGPQTA